MYEVEKIHPQTIFENIGKYSCLMQCYIYCAGFSPDAKLYFQICYDAITAGKEKSGIDTDCTVEDAELFLRWLTGRRYSVNKKVLCSIKSITTPTPVRFVATGYTPHFAVVAEGKVIFDPVLNSNSVSKGRPESARYIKLIQN